MERNTRYIKFLSVKLFKKHRMYSRTGFRWVHNRTVK